MAKVTGIPAPARGRFWVKCLNGRVSPANEAAARALTAQGLTTWPIAFELHTSGSRFAVPNAAMGDGVSDGDFIDIPATPFGSGVIIGPAVIISGTLIDNMGQERHLSRRGVIAEDSAGEWNINSPMTGDAFPTGNNTGGGAPAGALTTNDLDSLVPSQAAFNARTLPAVVPPLAPLVQEGQGAPILMSTNAVENIHVTANLLMVRYAASFTCAVGNNVRSYAKLSCPVPPGWLAVSVESGALEDATGIPLAVGSYGVNDIYVRLENTGAVSLRVNAIFRKA